MGFGDLLSLLKRLSRSLATPNNNHIILIRSFRESGNPTIGKYLWRDGFPPSRE
jgi:hypothetical protein